MTDEETCIDFATSSDRQALVEMLEESDDFPQDLIVHYRRPTYHNKMLIARRGETLVGVLTGSFALDFSDNWKLRAHRFPPTPHAVIERVHVADSARGSGIGRHLVHHFADIAHFKGCTYIAGHIDRSSDFRGRVAFFEKCGFDMIQPGSFGAAPSAVMATHCR